MQSEVNLSLYDQLAIHAEIFGRLTRLRTRHGFDITNRNWDCECGDVTPPHPAAVREHILHLCPLYAEERREFLSPISRLHEPMTLPGSEKGLLAMANFLKLTGALTSNGRPYSPTDLPTSEVDIADITDKDLLLHSGSPTPSYPYLLTIFLCLTEIIIISIHVTDATR